jgi:glycosyltransferase involved in cell wall biosynthesis
MPTVTYPPPLPVYRTGIGNTVLPVRPVITKLSIIIPAYNEEKTIALLLDKIKQAPLTDGIMKELIIVNDGSKDNTDQIIRSYIAGNPELPVIYIHQPCNQGKGAAIHAAISKATGDYVIIQDADLEYDPEEYNLLLRPILRGVADIVYGSRFMGHHAHRILFFWHTIGNKWLTFISNIFTNLNLTDAHTCYKLIKTSTLQQISLREKRFAFDAELNMKLSMIRGLRIYEVGISYYGRTYAEGKKIRWRDAMRTVYCLVKYFILARKTDLIAHPK